MRPVACRVRSRAGVKWTRARCRASSAANVAASTAADTCAAIGVSASTNPARFRSVASMYARSSKSAVLTSTGAAPAAPASASASA